MYFCSSRRRAVGMVTRTNSRRAFSSTLGQAKSGIWHLREVIVLLPATSRMARLCISFPSSLREVPPVYDLDDTNRLKRYSLVQLRDAALPKAVSTAEPQARMQVAYYRAEAIRRYALARANGHCEGCTQAAPFSSAQGPYLECHHLHRVADGGPDHPENVVALCPNCHRRAHYSKDAASFNAKLVEIVKAVEAAVTLPPLDASTPE